MPGTKAAVNMSKFEKDHQVCLLRRRKMRYFHLLSIYGSDICDMKSKMIYKYYILSTWKLNAFTCFAASSWGKELWKSMRAASSLCLENMILIIDTFTCIFACLEFT